MLLLSADLFTILCLLASVEGSDTKLFKTQSLGQHNIQTYNQLNTTDRQAIKSQICALECNIVNGCVGYLYNKPQKSCSLFSCLNPWINSTEMVQDVFYVQHPLVPNTQLTRGKPANTSSVRTNPHVDYPFIPDYAVDGIYLPPDDNEMLSIAHTNQDDKPWLRVDLEEVYCIWAVRILNRAKGMSRHWSRNRDVIISVSEKEEDIFYPDNIDSLCTYHDGILNQYYTLMICDQPISGQFVQMQLNVSDTINIYEFEVYGLDMP